MRRKLTLGLTTAVLLALQMSSALAFGAIAVNDTQGMAADEAGYGMGWGTSRKQAERDAVKNCKDAGNDDCKVAVWFETCGAYVGDRVNYGIGYGSTQKKAEKMAFEQCPNCKLVVSDCQ